MELRIQTTIDKKQAERLEELKVIFGIRNNAKLIKKLLDVVKL